MPSYKADTFKQYSILNLLYLSRINLAALCRLETWLWLCNLVLCLEAIISVTLDSKCDQFSLYYKSIKTSIDFLNNSCTISILSICTLSVFQTLIFLPKYSPIHSQAHVAVWVSGYCSSIGLKFFRQPVIGLELSGSDQARRVVHVNRGRSSRVWDIKYESMIRSECFHISLFDSLWSTDNILCIACSWTIAKFHFDA